MTLPLSPDVDTILASCIETLRDVVVPEVESEWARYSGELLVGALEYARSLLAEPPDGPRRAALQQVLEGLRPAVLVADDPAWRQAFADDSPFEIASRLLVQAQAADGPLADQVRAALRPLLRSQLDAEMARAMPLFIAFARNISSAR